MSWRGSTTPLDRTFACLPYLLPLAMGILLFGAPFFNQFPTLRVLLVPFAPILGLVGAPFVGIILFIALLLLVVRNENISHFIRFNTMQAILLDIILSISGLVLSLLGGPLGTGLIMETIFNVLFLGTLAAVIYSVAQSVMGRYAEIPTLSDAVYMQVR